ncbi:hypothetical protein Tco_1028494 [Tanacetum coccineum]|uniref:Uncharacterized protein n=1 Tax=Tanacetum coccineum TaxID=301880 RepID=A0ABQ5G0S4_9ASTR
MAEYESNSEGQYSIKNDTLADSDSDVKEDQRSSSEFLADLNAEYFQKECPSNKISTPSYPSTYKPYNKSKFHTNSTPQQSHINTDKNQKDYIVKYKGLKEEIVVLTKKIDAITKGKSEKGLVAKSFDWDEESVSSDDDDVIKVKALMAITEDELSVRMADARLC